MDRDRVLVLGGIVIGAASAVIGLVSKESVMFVSSVLAALLSCAAFFFCSDPLARRSTFLMSLIVLICTALMASVTSHETLVGGGIISADGQMYVAGIVSAAAVVPMILVFYFVTASAFKASYNWFVASVLSPFVGLGMLAPGYASILYIQRAEVDSGLLENVYIVMGLTMAIILFAVFAVILGYFMKRGRRLITEDGIGTNPAGSGTLFNPWKEMKAKQAGGAHRESDRTERRVAWGILIFCLLLMAFMYAYATAGLAPGIESGHPVEYLQMTCILWAGITAILPLLRLLKLVSLPLWFMILINANMCLYVVSLCMGLYLDLDWWGNLSHEIAAFIVASIVFLGLCMMQTHSPSSVSFGRRGGIVTMLIPLAASFGCIWEVAEGFTDILAGRNYMVYGILDTLGDLWADILGLLLMALIAWFILGRQSPEDVASKVRIGRDSMDIPE